jgi:chromosome segregation ATPase
MNRDEIVALIGRAELRVQRLSEEYESARNEMRELGYEIEDAENDLSNLRDDLECCEDEE